MITTINVCICDRCGAIEKMPENAYEQEIIPEGWEQSKVNPQVHFCPKCNPNIPNITPSDSPLYWPPGIRAVPTDYREYEITCKEN